MGYQDVVLADSPRVYFPLSETSGSIKDVKVGLSGPWSGSPLQGAVPIRPGAVQKSVDFNSSGYAIVPNNSLLSPQAGASGKISVELWLWINTLGSSYVVSKGDTPGYEWGVLLGATGLMSFIIWNSSGGTISSRTTTAAVLTTGTPLHIVCTWDWAGGANSSHGNNGPHYVNGASAALAAETGSAAGPGTATTSGLGVGRRADSGTVQAMRASDLAVYNYVLGASQVAEHYAEGLRGGVVLG